MRDPGPILIDSLDKPNAAPQGPGQPHPLTPIARRDERSTRRLPAQAWIILTIATLIVLAFVLWGVYSAIQALLWEYPWASAVMGLLLLLVACVAILALAYTLVMRLYLWVQGSRIIRSRLDVPIDSMMVLNRDPIALESAHLAYETAKIPSMINPLITTWTSPQTPQPKTEAPLLLTSGPSLVPDREWLGWLNEAPHGLIAGSTNSGKTTIARIALRQALEGGAAGFVIDPKGKDWYGLPVVGSGRQFAPILSALDGVREEMQQRFLAYGQGERVFTPLVIVVDEVPDIMDACKNARGTISDPRWSLFARSLGSLAREVQIRVWLLTQSPNVEDIGINGGMRANYTRLALREKIPLLLNEDVDPARREALRKLYSGQQHPAAMIRNGQAHLLDTSRVVDLSSQPYRGMGWLPPVDCQQPTKPSISIDELLVRAVRQGKTREATRATFQAKGLGFKDEQWTEARRFVLRERLGDAEAA